MAKHTHHFTSKIKQHLSAGKGLKQKQQWQKSSHCQPLQLPNKLKLSILRGEIIYRQQCFDFFAQKGFDENFTYVAFETLFNNSNMLAEFIQQIDLANVIEDYIKQGVANQSQTQKEQHLQLYALLIDHLAQQPDRSMLEHATVGLIQHYLPSYFPTKANAKPSLDMLRTQLKKTLNTLWHCQVTIKESFTTTKDIATMKLIAHVDNCYPTELICVESKRLRSARFKAYHQIQNQLDNNQVEISPTPKTLRKAK